MAKSHGSKRGNSTHYTYTARPAGLLRPSLSSLVLHPILPNPYDMALEDAHEALLEERLEDIEDRRRFDPDPVRPARTVGGKAASVRALYHAPMQVIGFQNPKHVMICVRRKIRREVIHALRKTRKGAGGQKRRNYYSNVRC